MATVPYGCVSRPLAILAEMLSNTAAYQRWVAEVDVDIPASGAERADYCLDYIYYPIYEKASGAFVYPAAVIEVPADLDFDVIAQSSDGGVYNTGSGLLNLTIYREVPSALRNNLRGAWLDYAGVDTDGVKSGLGAIIADLMDLPDSVNQFEAFDIALADGPAFFKEEKRAGAGHIIAATLRIAWGSRS